MDVAAHKALVVDDDSTNQLMLSMLLRRLGLKCDSAPTVEQALQLLSADRFDLVIVDVQLPDGDGVQIIRWLRAQADNPNRALPAMVISAETGAEHEKRCHAAGATMVFAKPVELDTFRKAVGKLVTGEAVPAPAAASPAPAAAPAPAPAPSGDRIETWRLTRRRYVHDLMNILLKARGASLMNPANPLGAIQEQVETAISLLAEYRELIQLAEGDVQQTPAAVDVAGLVGQLALDAGRVSLDGAQSPVWCDPGPLAELLTDLLERALARDGDVAVGTRPHDAHVDVVVAAAHDFVPRTEDGSFPSHEQNRIEPGLVKCLLIADAMRTPLHLEAAPGRLACVIRCPAPPA